MVQSGSIVTYNCTYLNSNFSAWQSLDPPAPSDVVAFVTAQAQANNLAVVSANLGQDPSLVTGYINNQFSLQVELLGDFNQLNDVKSILDNAVYQLTGNLPISSISVIQTPAGVVTQTGQPGLGATVNQSTGANLNSIVSNVTQGAATISGLLNPSSWSPIEALIIASLVIAVLAIAAFHFAPDGTSKALRAARGRA